MKYQFSCGWLASPILILDLILAFFWATNTIPSSEARIGEPITNFRAKTANIFQLKQVTHEPDKATEGHDEAHKKVYYAFVLKLDPAQQKSSRGFAGGMTLTTLDGKIVGESLLVRLGENQEVGKLLAVALCLNLTYEAIGKPVPKYPQIKQQEFDSYLRAISQALAGTPQRINYPHYAMHIILSCPHNQELLVAITPEASTK